jgi:hypothetical protein
MYKISGENTETQRHEAANADTKNTKEIYKIRLGLCQVLQDDGRSLSRVYVDRKYGYTFYQTKIRLGLCQVLQDDGRSLSRVYVDRKYGYTFCQTKIRLGLCQVLQDDGRSLSRIYVN